MRLQISLDIDWVIGDTCMFQQLPQPHAPKNPLTKRLSAPRQPGIEHSCIAF